MDPFHHIWDIEDARAIQFVGAMSLIYLAWDFVRARFKMPQIVVKMMMEKLIPPRRNSA